MSEELKQASAATNRALDAYVMDRVAGGERGAQLRGELNAAFYRQYDIDRRHTLNSIDAGDGPWTVVPEPVVADTEAGA